MTNSTSSSSSSKSIEFAYTYMVVGSVGMLANAFILMVLVSDKKLLKQSAIIAGVAISHLLCAFAIGTTGIYRVINFSSLGIKVWPWSCVLRIYPAANPFAFQSMGVMLILVGVERFTVFVFPNWYRIKWTHKMVWQLVGACYLAVTISECVGLYMAWNLENMTTLNCGYSSVFGKSYIIFGSSISATGGVIAVGFTLFGLLRGMSRAKKLPISELGRHRRQMKLTRSLLSVALFDFCLVVIPNVLYVVSVFDTEKQIFPDIASGNLSNFTNAAYCFNTVMSLIPYLSFNRAFRNAAMRLFGCKKAEVGPATVGDGITAGVTRVEMRTVPVRSAK